MSETVHELTVDVIEEDFCQRCGCCNQDWEECTNCEEGYSSHECGEDCCNCLDPRPNVICDICEGKGGWHVCLGHCDSKGKHENK